ncbi:hypothetical protein FRC15_007760 [Serendipita sp. 397]|nr:hypothetical protein FRC15_007760 [Serendipita sp. 397]KAG8773647.1 hypothetical protein FRC16_005314 [Serendipita sp. 398]
MSNESIENLSPTLSVIWKIVGLDIARMIKTGGGNARSILKADPEHEATLERGGNGGKNEAVERIAGNADDESTSRESSLRTALTWEST